MKFAILSLAAAGALAVSAGSVDAHPPAYYGGGYGGYARPVYPAPVYPAYGYGGYARPYYGNSYYSGYNSGFGLTIGGPSGVLSIGSGSVYPQLGYNNFYSRPYYGGGYGYGRRW